MTTNIKKVRDRLFTNDPHCRKCGVLTISPETVPNPACPPDNMATLEHIFSRYHPIRYSDDYLRMKAKDRRTLLCYRCNQNNAKEEQEFICESIRQELKEAKGMYLERLGNPQIHPKKFQPRDWPNYSIAEALVIIGFAPDSAQEKS